MIEREITSYHLEQPNKKIYIITTSLINEKIKILCKDSDSKIFSGLFTLTDLVAISPYFQNIQKVEQVQKYLNGIIERKRVEILTNNNNILIVIHLINNDILNIPLTYQTPKKNKPIDTQNKFDNFSPIQDYSNLDYYSHTPKLNYSPFQYNTFSHKENTNIKEFAQVIPYKITFITTPTSKNENNNKIFSNETYQNQTNYIPISPIKKNESTNNNFEKIPEKEINRNNYDIENQKISNEIKQLSSQVEEYIKEIEIYKKNQILLSKKANSFKNENLKLKSQVESYKNLIKEYQTQSKALKNQFSSLEKSILSFKEKNLQLLKANEQSENENKILKNKIEDITIENTNLKTEIDQLKKNNVNKNQINISEDIIKENTDLKTEIEQLKKNSESKELKIELEEISKENINLKTEIEQLKKNSENKNLKTKLEEINIENTELKTEIEKLKNNKENENLKNQIENLNKENMNLKSEIEKLKNNKEDENLKNQIENLNKENINLKSEIEKLKKNNEIKILKNKIEKITKENKKLKSEKRNLQQKNENKTEIITKENNNLKIEIEKLKKNYEKKIEEITSENTKLNSEMENLKKNCENKIKNNENEMAKLNKEIERYKINSLENDQFRNKIINLETLIQELTEKLEKTQEKEVKGDIIHNMKELKLITKKIKKKKSTRMIIDLLYKASIDGDSAQVFHQKCDKAKNTIVLIETKNGKRFGGYTTCNWSGNCIEKKDSETFIFSFDKMKTYDNIPGDNAIGCYPKFGPVFLGCQIKIFDDAFVNGGTTHEKELNFNTTEDYELTGGDKTFEIKDIEVYEVIYDDL